MLRGPRLDAPGVLHHVMVRGIERTAVFRDRRDRDAFLGRLAAVGQAGGAAVYAWALLPNHVHLLLRTGQVPLARVMRALLTGYAGAFNAPEAHKPTIGGQVAATTGSDISFRTATSPSSSTRIFTSWNSSATCT